MNRLVGKLVFPAQAISSFPDYLPTDPEYWGDERFFVQSLRNKKIKLETRLFVPPMIQDNSIATPFSGDPTKRTHIIFMLGAGSVFQFDQHIFMRRARTLQANVVCFNYRHTGNSTRHMPTKIRDLVDDAKAQVLFWLQDRNIPASRIVIVGQSLGGAVASQVVADLSQEYHGLRLFLDRTFALTSQVAPHSVDLYMRKRSMAMTANACAKLAAKLLRQSKWELDVVGHFANLPDAHKACVNAIDDDVIPWDSSLVKNLRDKGIKICPDSVFVAETKQGKDDWHVTCLETMFDRNGYSAFQYLADFVNRAR